MRNRSYKIVLLGNRNAGKTSVAYRFCEGKELTKCLPTIGVDCVGKIITGEDQQQSNLTLWDVTGDIAVNSRFQLAAKSYLKNADAILLFYDITDPKALTEMKGWALFIKKNVADLSQCKLMLVGNKCDLPAVMPAIAVQVCRALQQALQLPSLPSHTMVSAKSGDGISELFTHLANELPEKLEPEPVYTVQYVKPESTFLQRYGEGLVAGIITLGILIILASIFLWPVIAAAAIVSAVFMTICAIVAIGALSALAGIITHGRCHPEAWQEIDTSSYQQILTQQPELRGKGTFDAPVKAAKLQDDAEIPLIVMDEDNNNKEVTHGCTPSHSVQAGLTG